MNITNVDRIEKYISEFISKEVDIPEFDIDFDLNFGAFGLSSMAGMKLVGQLEELLETKIKPSMLFENPTISKLAQAIAARGMPSQAA